MRSPKKEIMENLNNSNDAEGNKNKQHENPSPNYKSKSFGEMLGSFSDLINDNLIIARYGTIATVFLLTSYGISKTPVFHRYKKVKDIDALSFTQRRTIHGRIVHVIENEIPIVNTTKHSNNKNEVPIVCLVRHLSPMGRLLNRSSFEYLARHLPSSHLKKDSPISDAKDLLKIEIAGIKAPPFYPPCTESPNEWLRHLATNQTPISCKFLSRRILQPTEQTKNNIYNYDNDDMNIDSTMQSTKRQRDTINLFHNDTIDVDNEQVAICQIKFRPSNHFFRKDLAASLVLHGRASVASNVHIDMPTKPTIDGSTILGDIEADVKYIESLVKEEFEAVKGKKGMWGIDEIRNQRPDLVDEAEFDANAGILRKVWRRLTD